MSDKLQLEVSQIVDTLLNVGERVVEVSRDQVMTRIWDRPGSPLSAYRAHYEGKKISEIRNDSTIASCRSDIEDAFASGKNSYTEYVSYKNDNNSIITYSLRVLACHPDKNYVFLVIENISKGRENTLIEDKWKMALDASGQGVWDANLKDKVIFFSDKWEELFGYNAKEIHHFADWSEKIHPDDLHAAELSMQEYVKGNTPIYSAEVRYRCKDGSYKWILSRGIVISKDEAGNPLRFIGTHTDIDDQKAVEEELREAKETFANSFNYSGIGKALLTPEGQWLEVNDVITELIGYTREELLQLNHKDITFPDDADIDIELVKKLYNGEIPSYSIQKRYVTKDRRVLTTDLTVTLVRDKDNKPKYYVCDIIDRTKKKAITEELRRKNADLEATSANLVSKMRQLEELNHMIAHNLRGPVGNIKMLSENPDIFPLQDAMPMIHTTSISLLSNLDTMVEIARIKLAKDPVYETCNVREFVNNIADQLRGIIYQKKIQLELHLKVEEIHYPRIYLEHILYNLISNAIKYSRDDIQPVIKIETKKTIEGIALSVKDNGIGIDLKRFGKKVFGLNQTFHTGYDSKGVGLFITKTQIESLGGTISVKSQPGKGCEFIVTIN